jgi:hypothetical protein
MLYSKIIAVCSQIHRKHTNSLCGRDIELLNVKPGGTYSDHWAPSTYILHVFIVTPPIRTLALSLKNLTNPPHVGNLTPIDLYLQQLRVLKPSHSSSENSTLISFSHLQYFTEDDIQYIINGTGNLCPRTGHKGPVEKQKYSSTVSSTSVQELGWCLTPRPGSFNPGKGTQYPLYRRLGGPQGRF